MAWGHSPLTAAKSKASTWHQSEAHFLFWFRIQSSRSCIGLKVVAIAAKKTKWKSRTRVVWQPQVSRINTPNSWSLWCKTWKSCACRELETPLGSCTFVEPRYSIIHCPEIGRARSAGFAKSNFKTGFRRGKLWYDMMRLKWLKWPNALLPCASLLVPEHSTCKERLSVDEPVRESDDETNAITRMPTKIRGDPQHFALRHVRSCKNYVYIYVCIIYIYTNVWRIIPGHESPLPWIYMVPKTSDMESIPQTRSTSLLCIRSEASWASSFRVRLK